MNENAAPARIGPRMELKIALPQDQAEELRSWCTEHLSRDSYMRDPKHGYLVESIYFDTPTRRAATDRGFPKYRVRRYDRDDSRWFLEEKISRSPRVWKRRTLVTPNDIYAMLGGEASERQEVEWFRGRFAELELHAELAVRYRRFAYDGEDGLRVTLDYDIEVSSAHEDTFSFDPSSSILRLSDRTILEVKYAGPRPALASELLARTAPPRGHSKYRLGLQAIDR